MTVERIVSGGQTGVDRAALEIARSLNIHFGGWCPRGRKAEDGRIPRRYALTETPSRKYAMRTKWNVRDSDGTLILTVGEPTGGTALTAAFAGEMQKPCLVVDLAGPVEAREIAEWLGRCGIRILNVAGPRESSYPGVHAKARTLLGEVLSRALSDASPSTPPPVRENG